METKEWMLEIAYGLLLAFLLINLLTQFCFLI